MVFIVITFRYFLAFTSLDWVEALYGKIKICIMFSTYTGRPSVRLLLVL